MGIRSFLAFELPEEIRRILRGVHHEAKDAPLDVRWVKPEGIHLTIIFLGDISESDLSPMGEAVARVGSSFGPFPLVLKGMGCFPNSRNPRVIWLGVESDLERMSRLKDDLHRILAPFGIRPENRPFQPHLTLGRFKRPAGKARELEDLISKFRGLTSPRCSLKELILFNSDLKPGGAVYTALRSCPLQGNQ